MINDNSSKTTLVAFSAAITSDHEHTPYFSGRKLARETGINLISVSDPSLHHRGINVAWYLGDQTTGPLRPVLVPAIQHALKELGANRTILFGSSGGGFTAAHYANDFPDSLVLIINPRLSLERSAEKPMSQYLKHGHTLETDGKLTEEGRALLSEYAPINISSELQNGLHSDLLIYQNILDPTYLENHFVPFAATLGDHPRVHVQFGNDGAGHKRIAFPKLQDIVISLTEHTEKAEAVTKAGFGPLEEASFEALKLLPQVALDIRALARQHKKVAGQKDELEQEVALLRQQANTLAAQLHDLMRPSTDYRPGRHAAE